MPLSVSYIIVPFAVAADGRAMPAPPQRSATRTGAIAAADRLTPYHAGVVVLQERSDPAAGIFPEPVLVCVIGDVPDTVVTALAA